MPSKLPWGERVRMLSIHPDAASRKDIARMAAELDEARDIMLHMLEGDDVTVRVAVLLGEQPRES